MCIRDSYAGTRIPLELVSLKDSKAHILLFLEAAFLVVGCYAPLVPFFYISHKALEWVDLGAAVLERGSSAGPVPLWPPPASQPLVAAPGAQPKTSGRKTWLETPRHDKWLAQ